MELSGLFQEHMSMLSHPALILSYQGTLDKGKEKGVRDITPLLGLSVPDET